MGKKKQQKDTTSFKNDPFRTVKGFSVLKQELKPQPESEVKPQRKVPDTVNEDTEVDFNRAMAQLGVEQIAADSVKIASSVAPDDEEVVPAHGAKHSSPADNSDEELFMASLGQLDTVFNDDYADEEDLQSQGAEPRRMKQLRQGRLKPQDTLDLHGCYRDEAREKVRYFLQNRHAAGLHTVLIVTGKGKRSPNGEPVLRSDVEKYLSTRATAWVTEWGRAPRQYGGEGALVVFLRTRNG